MNPVPLKDTVEVIRGHHTSDLAELDETTLSLDLRLNVTFRPELTLMYFPNGIVGTLARKRKLPRFLNWD